MGFDHAWMEPYFIASFLSAVKMNERLSFLFLASSYSVRSLRLAHLYQPRPRFTGLRTDPALAVLAGAALGRCQLQHHRLGGHQRRVQADRPRRGGPEVGRAEVEAEHELRQTEQSSSVG
jgi:hypothetical protein